LDSLAPWIIGTVVALLLLVLIWRLTRRSVPDPLAPESLVPANLKRGPKDRAGAVALEEPDDEDRNA
jgi:hypothetical protein